MMKLESQRRELARARAHIHKIQASQVTIHTSRVTRHASHVSHPRMKSSASSKNPLCNWKRGRVVVRLGVWGLGFGVWGLGFGGLHFVEVVLESTGELFGHLEARHTSLRTSPVIRHTLSIQLDDKMLESFTSDPSKHTTCTGSENAHVYTDTNIHRHTDTQTHRHTDTQAHRHTHSHKACGSAYPRGR